MSTVLKLTQVLLVLASLCESLPVSVNSSRRIKRDALEQYLHFSNMGYLMKRLQVETNAAHQRQCGSTGVCEGESGSCGLERLKEKQVNLFLTDPPNPLKSSTRLYSELLELYEPVVEALQQLKQREDSSLCAVNRVTNEATHQYCSHLTSAVEAGDLLVKHLQNVLQEREEALPHHTQAIVVPQTAICTSSLLKETAIRSKNLLKIIKEERRHLL